ncbi:glucose-6-phosphate isomerase [Leptolyngbya sp. NIES-2104]|uniref:glucose-6-phosphate isomerase n=1 Tax=Leptolyngbya sp. NIES-2104 TaxID=1552121 RepID=UPI0006EC455F|nr:glucose-6-phosphate isomerase [Leptolyngbya sp. NIES-2104]GAP99186.1 glucose-6-phosphate isomerase [Leptolyngbya sp. NIES-2104]
MHTTQPQPKSPQLSEPWLLVGCLIAFTALCLAVNAASILRLVFPAGSLAVGALLFFRYPIFYIGYTWWLWFLTPFVRRLIDWEVGWLDPNPVLLAPFFVAFIPILTLLIQLPKAIKGNGLPFVMSAAAVLYGAFIGLLSYSSQTVIIALLSWMTPILFGYYIFSHWRNFPELKRVTEKTFLWGILVMGIYGVIQFLVAPVWDQYWLQNLINLLQIYSFGTPNPLGIRVFSTMHSPQPFATVMVAGLLLLFAIKSPIKIASSAFGYLAFLLTLARTSWLSWFIGLIVFIPSLKPRLQMRLIVTLMVMSLVVLPLAMIEPFSTVISSRFQTFFSAQQDGSFIDRSLGYSNLLSEAFSEIEGRGLGYVIRDANIGGNDSGILTLFLNLGWIGTIPYVAGMVLLVVNALQTRQASNDPFVGACRAIVIATVSQISLNTVFLTPFGIVLWGFMGLAAAARLYETQQAANPPTIETILDQR